MCVRIKTPKNERGEEEGEKDGRKEGRERKKERGRERGKEKGRVERNASSMQETDIFNNEDDFFIYTYSCIQVSKGQRQLVKSEELIKSSHVHVCSIVLYINSKIWYGGAQTLSCS